MENLTTVNGNEKVSFDKNIESFVQKLSTLFGLSTRIQKQDGNRGKIYIGRKTYSITFGERFIRISKEGSKIQIPYTGNKNTVSKLSRKIEEFK